VLHRRIVSCIRLVYQFTCVAVLMAMSKRTKFQCGAPAMHGKTKCKTHGGLSTGPRTDEGKLRCAQAKTIHGNDTRADRQVHRLAMKRLRLYAQILGVPFRADAGDKRLKYLR
jgi:hypothetical protein